MNANMKKVLIISTIVLTTAGIARFVIYPAIKRSNIRKNLDKAFKDPSSVDAVGGLDKLQVTGVFDPYKFDDQNNHATITRIEARERAEQIWDNYSAWLSSNQTAIIGAFNGLGHVDDVSKISHEFYALYDQELLTIIKEALTDKSQYNLLIGKISKLPKN